MSEMRKFLLYEIPGLFSFIYLSLFIICFEDLTYFTKLATGDWQQLAAAVAVIVIVAIPVGWLEYQIYDSLWHVHYRTMSFRFVKGKMSKEMKKECIHAVVDHILKDCYKKYSALGDDFRAFWDYYKARNIVGSLGIFYLLVVVYWIKVLEQSPIHWNIFKYLDSLILILSLLIILDARRIRKEVENREYLYMLDSKINLDNIKTKINSSHNHQESGEE